MATVAEFTVVPGDFPLGTLIVNRPGVRIRLEQVVPTHSNPIPYFWVHGSNSEEITEAFRDSPDVERTRIVDDVDEELLVRVEWKPGANGILRATRETDVTLLSAEGTTEGWTLEIRGDDTELIKAFQAKCSELSIPIELRTLHRMMPLVGSTEYSLTERQRDALIAAHERGYFDSPQQVTLEELGSEFDITGQSFGSRLRRGTKRLIEAALVDT